MNKEILKQQQIKLLNDPMNVHIIDIITKKVKHKHIEYRQELTIYNSRNRLYRFWVNPPCSFIYTRMIEDVSPEVPVSYRELDSRTNTLAAARLINKEPWVRDFALSLPKGE